MTNADKKPAVEAERAKREKLIRELPEEDPRDLEDIRRYSERLMRPLNLGLWKPHIRTSTG